MYIHERITSLLKDKGISQQELAEQTGIKASAISDWKRKNTNPSADAIIKISEYLEVSTDYLLKGEETISSSEPDELKQKIIAFCEELGIGPCVGRKMIVQAIQAAVKNERL